MPLNAYTTQEKVNRALRALCLAFSPKATDKDKEEALHLSAEVIDTIKFPDEE